MKIEAHCAHCKKGYLVDEAAIGSGLPCPGCFQPLGGIEEKKPKVVNRVASNAAAEVSIDLPAEAPVAPAPVQAAAPAPTPAPAPAPAPAPVAAAPVAAAPAAAVAQEVVCPRCNLHFSPRADQRPVAGVKQDRPTVLVVEDMAYFREIASDALSDDYDVKGVETSDAALAVLSQGKVDLMVLDLTLDGGDGGVQLLRKLGTKPCPILIYTAQDESEMYGDSWDELRSFGADDIVIKGMNVGDELVRKVGSLLGREETE